MFVSSSLTVSMIVLFLSSSLSDTLISAPFMLFFNFVMSCIPSTKSLSKRFLLIYSLICDELPVNKVHKSLVFERFPVIYVTMCYHEIKQLAAFVYPSRYEGFDIPIIDWQHKAVSLLWQLQVRVSRRLEVPIVSTLIPTTCVLWHKLSVSCSMKTMSAKSDCALTVLISAVSRVPTWRQRMLEE